MFARKFAAAGCAAVLLALGTSAASAGPTDKAATRIEKTVKSLGYKYAVEKNGFIMVQYPVMEDKTLPVAVDSKLSTIDGKEKRLVFCLATVYDKKVPADAAAMIKRANERSKNGQFVVVDGADGKKLVVFLSTIDPDADADDLDDTMKKVAERAVNMYVALKDLE